MAIKIDDDVYLANDFSIMGFEKNISYKFGEFFYTIVIKSANGRILKYSCQLGEFQELIEDMQNII